MSSPNRSAQMDHREGLPPELDQLLSDLDVFIASQIEPLQQADDNARFFDHRREFARTDVDAGGVPRKAWLELLAQMRRRADAAGWWRFALPVELGGRGGTNFEMAVIREHLARKPLGLYNDLQSEMSVVANNPSAILLHLYGSESQKELLLASIFRVA